MDEAMKKKLIYIIGGFAGFIILLFLVSSCSPKKYSYEKLEKKMLQVAKDYYKHKEDQLPTQDKDSRTYTLKKMISDGKIEELTELFGDESVKCDGNVTVTNNNGYYLYSPYLNCGDKYKTVYLKDKIIEDSLVENGVGLYETNNQYIFKGETKNNYLTLNGKDYRIIRINDDGTIKAVYLEIQKQVIWDDRYNTDKRMNLGINEYEYNNLNSRFKDILNSMYTNVFNEEDRTYISTQSLCIGKRSVNDITKDGYTECSKIIENQTIGALAIYEYLQASLDQNCSYTNDRNCVNYNWLANIDSTWTITANVENSHEVYYINEEVRNRIASTTSNVYPVVLLSDKLIYVDGDGSIDNPYQVK